MDQQLRDCNAKIDEAEAYARAEGKRIAAKYEGRVSFKQAFTRKKIPFMVYFSLDNLKLK